MSKPPVRPIPELIDLLPNIRRRMRGDEVADIDNDPLKLRRVDIPLHSRSTILAILRRSEDDSEVLAPVTEQLDGCIVESGYAVLLLTHEEAKAAECCIAMHGHGDEQRLCLLFAVAPIIVAEVPVWRP